MDTVDYLTRNLYVHGYIRVYSDTLQPLQPHFLYAFIYLYLFYNHQGYEHLIFISCKTVFIMCFTLWVLLSVCVSTWQKLVLKTPLTGANTTSTLSSLSVHTFWPHSVQAYSFCPLLLLNFRQKLVLHVPLGMLYIMSLALSGAFIRVTATSRTEKVAV